MRSLVGACGVTLQTIAKFRQLFSGNTNTVGQFIPSNEPIAQGAKQKGTCTTLKTPLTERHYVKHLSGEVGLGVCPVDEEGNCHFTVIDVDVYDKSRTQYLIEAIREHAFPLYVFLSKSGGLHLYTFYTQKITAKKAIANAQFMRTMLGLPANTEIFPKQTQIVKGASGNWINLPYFDGDNSTRTLLLPEGPVNDVEYAINNCISAITTADFTAWKNSLPLNDAPPCLQTLYLQNNTTDRNNYLFSLAVYCKQKYGDMFAQHIIDANARLPEPLAERELETTIISSHTKHTYGYRCKDTPLCSYCDKRECHLRAFSADTSGKDGISFEQLIKYESEEPYYTWQVNGTELYFNNVNELIDQSKFRSSVMAKLNILPARYKDADWTDVINRALENVIVKQDNGGNMDGVQSITSTAIKEYLYDAQIGDIDYVLSTGKPYYDRTLGHIVIKPELLVKAVQSVVGGVQNTRDLMRRVTMLYGAERTTRRVRGVTVPVYVMTADSVIAEDEWQQWVLSKTSAQVDIKQAIQDAMTAEDLV